MPHARLAIALLAAALVLPAAAQAAPPRFEAKVSGEQVTTATIRAQNCDGVAVSADWSEKVVFQSRKPAKFSPTWRHGIPSLLGTGSGAQVVLDVAGTVERQSALGQGGDPLAASCGPASPGASDCGTKSFRGLRLLLQPEVGSRFRGLSLGSAAEPPADPFKSCQPGRIGASFPDFLSKRGSLRCFGEGKLTDLFASVSRGFLKGRGGRLTEKVEGSIDTRCDDHEQGGQGTTTIRWTLELERVRR